MIVLIKMLTYYSQYGQAACPARDYEFGCKVTVFRAFGQIFQEFFYSKKLSFMILDKYIGLVALVDDVISRLFANFALKLC